MNAPELVAYWMREREAIRMKRAQGLPPPWSEDPIFQRYRFCNVRREDDRVTIWLAQNWRIPFAEHLNLTLAFVAARYLNWPPTLAELGFPSEWDPARFLLALKARQDRGERCWNDAYMVTTTGRAIGKAEYLVELLEEVARRNLHPKDGDTLAAFAARLQAIDGLGSFLTGQVIADLKYVEPLRTAMDWWTWAAPGPGSRRGLVWWHKERQLSGSMRFEDALRDLAETVESLVPELMPMHAQDLQNVACELSKYVGALDGKQPKRLYRSTEQDYAL